MGGAVGPVVGPVVSCPGDAPQPSAGRLRVVGSAAHANHTPPSGGHFRVRSRRPLKGPLSALDWVLDHSTVRGVDRLVLIAVARHANADGLRCWPSQRRIADQAAVSRQTVRRALVRLENAGELMVRRPERVGRGRHNRYIVVMGRDIADLAATVDDRWASFAPRLFPQPVDTPVDGRAEKARTTPEKARLWGGPELVPVGTRTVQSPLVVVINSPPGGCDLCAGDGRVVDETNTVRPCPCRGGRPPLSAAR